MWFSRSVRSSGRPAYQANASVTARRVVSMMLRSPTVTESDSGLSRIPPQVGHGRCVM
jgi:hypothetical protein